MELLKMIKSAFVGSELHKESEEAIKSDIRLKVTTSLLMSAVSFALTALNFYKQYWFMMRTTLTLAVGFVVCAILCGKFKQRRTATIIMAMLSGFIFSVYALTGENEGFAILWIMLVPPISMSLVGIRVGAALSMYFQVFLIALFYTPFKQYVAGYYTETFQMRFPLLYMTSFAAALLLTAQKEYYYQQTEKMAYMDSLTGMFNRRKYDEQKALIEEKGEQGRLSVILIDINRLKYVNDTFGHEAGDELIRQTADCIAKEITADDYLSRIGGDEFAVLSFEEPQELDARLKRIEEAAEQCRTEFYDGISLSAGRASMCDHPGLSVEELEKEADAAMYAAKSAFYVKTGLDRRK